MPKVTTARAKPLKKSTALNAAEAHTITLRLRSLRGQLATETNSVARKELSALIAFWSKKLTG